MLVVWLVTEWRSLTPCAGAHSRIQFNTHIADTNDREDRNKYVAYRQNIYMLILNFNQVFTYAAYWVKSR